MTFPPDPTPTQNRLRKVKLERAAFDPVTVVSFAVGILGFPGPLISAFAGRGWQYAVVGAGFALLALCALASWLATQTDRKRLATWLLMAGAGALGLCLAVAINQLGLLTGIGILILFPALARDRLPEGQSQRAIYAAVGIASATLLVDLFDAFPTLPQPVSTPILVVVDGLAAAALAVIVARPFQTYTLRTKLILTFLVMTLVPVGLLTFLNSQSTQAALRNEANEKLGGAASQTAAVLDAYVQDNLTNITTEAEISTLVDFVSGTPEQQADPTQRDQVQRLLILLAKRDPFNLRVLGLLDANGNNLLDVSSPMVGENEAERDYFIQPLNSRRAYVSPIEFSPSDGRPAIFFSSPVFNNRSQVAGVLRVGISADVIQNIIDHSAGLAGPGSYAVVYDEYFLNIALSNQPDMMLNPAGPISSSLAGQLVAAHRLPSFVSTDTGMAGLEPAIVPALRSADSQPYFEARDPVHPDARDRVGVRRMTTRPWLVAFFQPQSILFAPAEAQTRNGLLLSLLVAAAVTLAAIIIARFLAGPIVELTQVARRLGEGELSAHVTVTAKDEIGVLGHAFNTMTQQMQELVAGLEERVAERTSDLQRRARQLQASAEVARDAAGIREVDQLLNETVRLISDRFGYYHAGVFLVDPSGENAVLRAASSEGGRRMLSRGHSLAVGKVGIVGYVTGTGKPRIALDVGEDAVHFANPDLPKTRSEMALPLLAAERVIGALDVQSVEPNAFDQQDLVALQTMADQLAIAIQNATLLSREIDLAAQRRRALDIYRQLSQHMSYDQIIADVTRLIRGAYGYDRVTLGMVEGNEVIVRSASARSQDRLPRLGQGGPIGQGLLGLAAEQRKVVRMSRSRLQETIPDDPALGHLGSALAVPLISRGVVLGVLAAEVSEDRTATDDEVELVELLAGQVAVAIENARLFEETQQSLRQVDLLYRRQTSEAWESLLSNRRTQGQDNIAAFGDSDALSVTPAIEMPISLRGEVIGKLDVLPPDPSKWTDEDREILNAVAEEVAGQLEQLRLMEEIQRRATQMETAAEIARVATGLLDLDGLLERAVGLIRERFGYYSVSLYLLDSGGKTAELRQAAGHAAQTMLNQRPKEPVGGRSILGFVAESGEYYVAHDVEADPYFRPSPLLPDTKSELAVPLRVGESVIGALDVQDSRPYAFSEDDISVLSTLADQLAVAVQNARSYEAALRQAEREQKVLEITSRIRASSDIDSMLKTAVRELRLAVGARRGAIRLSASSESEPELVPTPPPSKSESNGWVADGNGAKA